MAAAYIVMPLNDKTKNWISRHAEPKLMRFGHGIVILEQAYLNTIVDLMEAAGFKRGTSSDIGSRRKFDFIVNTLK